MAKRNISPELRERLRQTREEGERARAQMQRALDRLEARQQQLERSRWRRTLRRLHLA